MIKVIPNQVVCKNCMAKLEYESSDVIQTVTKYPNIWQMLNTLPNFNLYSTLYRLDFNYTQRSGDKWVSKWLYNKSISEAYAYIQPTDYKDARTKSLFYSLFEIYGRKWDGLCKAFLLQYNPIIYIIITEIVNIIDGFNRSEHGNALLPSVGGSEK